MIDYRELKNNKHILIAPLNWGLGHATRSIPLINKYLAKNYTVYIATSGDSLIFLQKQFPKVCFIELPDYSIKYNKGLPVWLSVFFQIPKILFSINKERNLIKHLHNKHPFKEIISDNRYGVYVKGIKNSIVCHQLNLLTSKNLFSRIINSIHFSLLNKFDNILVPDYPELVQRISGLMSEKTSDKVRFINPQSYLSVNNTVGKNKTILIFLSGLEPYRSILENKLLEVVQSPFLKDYTINCIGGSLNNTLNHKYKSINYKSFLVGNDLTNEIENASVIIARSGYSTIMDIHQLTKKRIILIPTPGQTEQEYLANYLSNKFSYFYTIRQKEISEKKLIEYITN